MTVFNNLATTKLGNMGEGYIPEFCKAKNSKPYQPTNNGSNPIDGICIMNKDKRIFGIEVKTKGSMLYKDATGMDKADHETYVNMNMNIPIYILFVDWVRREIYGQWISKLKKVVEPLGDDCVIYPLSSMDLYRKLSPMEIKALKEASNSKYYN